jgi:hypothetical protein
VINVKPKMKPIRVNRMIMLYIADRLIQFYEDFEGFCEWIKSIERLGMLERVEIKDNLVAVKGKIATGLSPRYEPPLNFVLLSLALFGEGWIYLPDSKQAFEKIKKWWREQVRKSLEMEVVK